MGDLGFNGSSRHGPSRPRKLSNGEAGLAPEAGRRAQEAKRRNHWHRRAVGLSVPGQDGEAAAPGPPLPGVRDSSPGRHGPAGDGSAGLQLPAGRCHPDL